VAVAGDEKTGRGARLICAARLAPGYGVETVLAAFGMLAGDRPGLGLDLLGAGPAEAALRTQVRALALEDRVRLRGLPAAAEVRAALRRCRALVLPRWTEVPHDPDPLPGLVFDALTGGTPLVTTSSSGRPHRPGQPGAWPVAAPDAPVGLALTLAAVLDGAGAGAPRRQPLRRHTGR
jgi:glycosyltransferase involved in cell wall biosynthesis